MNMTFIMRLEENITSKKHESIETFYLVQKWRQFWRLSREIEIKTFSYIIKGTQ